MADWTPLDDDPDTGTHLDVAVLRLEGQALEVRRCAIGPAPPDDATGGELWLDTSGDYPVLREYKDEGAGLAWLPILTRLGGSLNGDPDVLDSREEPFPFLGLRYENVDDLPALSPTNTGLVVYREGDEVVWVAGIGAWHGQLYVREGVSYDTVELSLEGEVGNDLVNPPTLEAKGVLQGWLFDAVAETRTFLFRVPLNWQGATPLRFRIWQLLDAAEIAGDDIEWEGEFRSFEPGTTKATKAATALVDAATDIGADVDGIDEGGVHQTFFDIPHDDVANPIAPGDLVAVTLNRKTVGGAGKVDGVVVIRAQAEYVQSPKHERA